MMFGGSPVPGSVRILVAESNQLLVDRLSVLSKEYSDLSLVGAAPTGFAAVAAAHRMNPDVVLIDEQLPDTDGLHVCEHIHRQVPRAAIILISDSPTDQSMLAAVEAGACGLISPLASDEDVIVTILGAADGEFLLPRPVVQRLFRIARELRQQTCNRETPRACEKAATDRSESTQPDT